MGCLAALGTDYSDSRCTLDGINEKGLTVAVLRIGDEPTNQDTGGING